MIAAGWIRQGLQFLFGVVVGAVITTLVQEQFDRERERRQAAQDLVAVFNGDHIAAHRDRLSRFALEEGTIEVMHAGHTAAAYVAAMGERMSGRPDLLVSILALADFYRSVDFCVRSGTCDAGRAEVAFEIHAQDYYGLAYPFLRRADCRLNYPDIEGIVARVAGLPDPGLDRCDLLGAAG